MYTNEFGQTVRPDWVSLSIAREQLTNLFSVIFRSMVRDSSVHAEFVDIADVKPYTVVTVTNATEEHVEPIRKATGVACYYHDTQIIFNDGNEIFHRMLELMTGSESTYTYDEDNDFIISISFDSYIRETFGL